MQGLFDRVCVIMSAEKDICNSQLNELNTSDGTLLWDNCRLIGRSLIVLARKVQNNCGLIGYTRIYSEDIIPAQEQHKYQCL